MFDAGLKDAPLEGARGRLLQRQDQKDRSVTIFQPIRPIGHRTAEVDRHCIRLTWSVRTRSSEAGVQWPAAAASVSWSSGRL